MQTDKQGEEIREKKIKKIPCTHSASNDDNTIYIPLRAPCIISNQLEKLSFMLEKNAKQLICIFRAYLYQFAFLATDTNSWIVML